eukprot:scaffold665_cov341-Prasinococcus_capsulatus_cf.AAC.11
MVTSDRNNAAHSVLTPVNFSSTTATKIRVVMHLVRNARTEGGNPELWPRPELGLPAMHS